MWSFEFAQKLLGVGTTRRVGGWNSKDGGLVHARFFQLENEIVNGSRCNGDQTASPARML
jgi:hypothetical protein